MRQGVACGRLCDKHKLHRRDRRKNRQKASRNIQEVLQLYERLLQFRLVVTKNKCYLLQKKRVTFILMFKIKFIQLIHILTLYHIKVLKY